MINGRELSILLDSIELPYGIVWYDIDGLKAFPIRGADGAPLERFICYLIKPMHGSRFWYKYGIEFSMLDDIKNFPKIIQTSLEKFIAQLNFNNAIKFNPDGGDLGRGDNLQEKG